jgi:branched-chain amino acid transport system permease protein
VIGALVFIPVREYTRTALSGNATGLGWVLVGVVIVFISIYRPGGILNEYLGRWD